MKFLYLIYLNIKRVIKAHTLIFFILIMGFIISGFAIGVYYRQASQIILIADTRTGTYSSVELHNDVYPVYYERICDTAGKLEENGDTPEITCISAACYDSEKYDCIGITGNAYISGQIAGDFSRALKKGEGYFPLSFFDIKEEETISQYIGTQATYGGKTYTVTGIYDDKLYGPQHYDSRRIKDSEIEISGSGYMGLERIDRDVPAIFISLADFGTEYTVSSLRILYQKGLSEEQRSDIEFKIYKDAVIDDSVKELYTESELPELFEVERSNVFAQWESAKKVYDVQFYSQLLLYIFAVALSMANIIMLYATILEMNEHQNDIFYILGLPVFLNAAAIILEIVIYSVFSFSIGFILADIFEKTSGLIALTRNISFETNILMMLTMVCIVLLCLSKKIRKHTTNLRRCK